jgi:hypothetical protein
MKINPESICIALLFSLSIDSYAASFFDANLNTSDVLLKNVWQNEKSLILSHRETPAVGNGDQIPPFFHPDGIWALGTLWMTADPQPLFDSLLRVQHPQNHTPLEEAHLPLASYTFDWPYLLHRYFEFSGDREHSYPFAKAYVSPWLDYFSGMENESGLLSLEKIPQAWTDSKPADWSDDVYFWYLNLRYLHALIGADEITRSIGLENEILVSKINAVKNICSTELGKAAVFHRSDGSPLPPSVIPVLANGIVLDVLHPDYEPLFVQVLRKHGLPKEEWLTATLLEACVKIGEHQLAYDFVTFADSTQKTPVMTKVFYETILGISISQNGTAIGISPIHLAALEDIRVGIPVPSGKVTFHSEELSNRSITTPTGVAVHVGWAQGVRTVVQTSVSHDNPEPLTASQKALLESKAWAKWDTSNPAIWVSVKEQMFRIIQDEKVLYQTRCATASKGTGSVMNSLQTPLGWHSINRKVGEGAPWGQVFRSRQATREVWQPGEDTEEDLVLSRILLLTGEEKGLNKGGNVDSYARNIYIHGTNDEARIGQPTSHGCIRLRNDDVIEIFDQLELDTKVLITDE